MAEMSVDEHDEKVRELKSMKKRSWILIAVAFALTVAAIVALVVGMNYIPKIYAEGIGSDGVPYKDYQGLSYDKLSDILACTIALVIANFVLFVLLQKSIWINKDTFKVSFVCKIIKVILHIIAVLLIAIMVLVTGLLYLSAGFTYRSAYINGKYVYKTASIWILGVSGMSAVGEAIILLVYYWNERFARGPAGADTYYMHNHKKLLNRSERAYGFNKFYIAVPYVAYLIGFFASAALGYFAEKFGRVMCGGIQLIVIAVAVIWSVYLFFKKYRLSKSTVRGFHARNGLPNGKSGSSVKLDYSENEEPKPIDKGYAAGKKLLSNELFAYNDLKFIPLSYDWPNLVSGVRWTQALELDNKQTCFISERIILRGGLSFQIKREAMYPNDSANEILEKTIDNIENKVRELLDELADKYSNYNKNFTIDCSRIKISYKIV
ncbi:MAG: hypothetical protein K2K13_03750 [Clostridiales bacterium]|nr:hypothetical protein [Clostridiales bacterium]